jgi:hypothetical protein
VHGSPHRHLDRFQVESAALALVLKNEPQQRTYFPFDFLPDRLGRFFSRGVRVSSTGRAWQIFSLVSIKVRLNSRYFRKPATSRSAFRWATALGKLSVTVLPSTL